MILFPRKPLAPVVIIIFSYLDYSIRRMNVIVVWGGIGGCWEGYAVGWRGRHVVGRCRCVVVVDLICCWTVGLKK